MNKPLFDTSTMTRPIHCYDYKANSGVYSEFHEHEVGQLLYYISGDSLLFTESMLVRLAPDRVVWIPPNTPHRSENINPYHYRSLYIDTKVFGDLPQSVSVKFITPLLKELIKDASNWGGACSQEIINDHKDVLIVHEIINAEDFKEDIFIPNERRLVPICTALVNNPENNFSLQEWGQEVGASEKTLARLFKKELGCTFHQWRLTVRMMHASVLLKRGETVMDVSFKVGYGSPGAFNTAFRAYFGKTATVYCGKSCGDK
ncbi:AraC family transcriptional regulator [Shewanella waksmanii]|uniref:AraC family transcriptional regulator n=1 Tax=Shewanella waksmanii TaxID=213783 RepID=UPI00146FC284|nr:helix-turn-helix transcriptional regulator [Shewanella waksmanii]